MGVVDPETVIVAWSPTFNWPTWELSTVAFTM
jgi:hypothetical protein